MYKWMARGIGIIITLGSLVTFLYLGGITTTVVWEEDGIQNLDIVSSQDEVDWIKELMVNEDDVASLSKNPVGAVINGFKKIIAFGTLSSTLLLLVFTLLVVSLGKMWVYLKIYNEYIPLYLQKGGKVIDKKGTYGTAAWLDKELLKTYISKKYVGTVEGIPLGCIENPANKTIKDIRSDLITLPDNPRFNENIFVYAPPGEGKTYAFVKTLIMNVLMSKEKYPSSFIINDSKGDVYKEVGNYLKTFHNYNVILINLVNLKASNCFNPLDFVESEQDAQIVVDMILKNVHVDQVNNNSSDPFWAEGESSIFIATIMLFKFEYAVDATIGMTYDFLNDNSYEELNKVFMKVGKDRPCRRIYNTFLKTKEEIRGNMIFGLCTKLQLFALEDVRNMTSKTDFDIYDLKRAKTAIFFVIPDTNKTMNYLLVLIKAVVTEKLIKYIDSSSDPMIRNRKIIQIDDEIANTGIIPQYQSWINTFRSRRWILIPIFQNLNQPKEMFGDQWISVYTACHTKICIGANDPETAEFISKELGEQSIRVMTKFKNAGITHMLEDEKWSQTDQKANLMNPDQVQKLDIDMQLVFRRGCEPMKLYKVGWEHYDQMSKDALSCQQSIHDYISHNNKIFTF